MSDADDNLQQLVDEYNRLVREFNRLSEINAELKADRNACAYEVQSSTEAIRSVSECWIPPLAVTESETDKKEVIANNALLALNDLYDSFRRLQNGSTASKKLAEHQDKYYALFGLYNDLRRVSLGYVVGLDKNFWQSDVPRKKVEKMYLANTDYWLAYATMAVMLWASDEQEACERAVSKAMQANERKSALYFLLAALRFNRVEAAREWYRVYFELVDLNGVGEEIIYIIQVLLSGALGVDAEFGNTVLQRLRALLDEANRNINTKTQAQASVDKYFTSFISVTDKEFIALKHICAEYDKMIALLSYAEKNQLLKDHFETVLNSQSELSDRISERIEDALYALISANDEAEQELLDKITQAEMIVKADGNMQVAQEAYAALMSERRNEKNFALILVNAALDTDSNADTRVKKFALAYIRSYCLDGAAKFSQYRKQEKREYDFNVDGCPLRGDENSFEQNKPKLLNYYDGLIKKAAKADKGVKTLTNFSIVLCVLLSLFTVLSVVGFIVHWTTAIPVVMLVIAVLSIGGFTLCLIFRSEQKKKVRKSFEYRIANGVKMLQDGLKDLAAWRTAYRAADKVYEELIHVLKEEVRNG